MSCGSECALEVNSCEQRRGLRPVCWPHQLIHTNQTQRQNNTHNGKTTHRFISWGRTCIKAGPTDGLS